MTGRPRAYIPERESQGQNEYLTRQAWAERANDAYLTRVRMAIEAEAERARVTPGRAMLCLANSVTPYPEPVTFIPRRAVA
jgi:hypothetical protein